MACKFRIRAVLNDCTHQHARPGKNEYRIGAEFSGGTAMSITYSVDTLPQDRTCCFISMVIISMFCSLYISFFLATQELVLDRSTETTITVFYTPPPGVNGSQIIARNVKRGRFSGSCDTRGEVCRLFGLPSGFLYDIWVRTCNGSEPSRCILRVLPAEIPTFPKRKSLMN